MWAKVWAMFPRPSGAFRLVSSFPRLKPWAKFQGPCRGRGPRYSRGRRERPVAARHHFATLIFLLSYGYRSERYCA